MGKNITKHQGKYNKRIYIWITTVVLLLILSFSTVLYINIQSNIINHEFQSNRLFLSQIKYNIDYMDEMVKKYCSYNYFYNQDFKLIMDYNKSDLELTTTAINNIQNVVCSAAFLDSVYIFNKYQNKFYTTNMGLVDKDNSIEIIKKLYNNNIPKFKLVLLRTDNLIEGNHYVFSYFMYDNDSSKGEMNNLVVFNIRTDWLFNNLQKINLLSETKGSKIIVMTDNNEFVQNPSEDNTFVNEFKKSYSDYLKRIRSKTAINSEAFDCNIGGSKYLATYVNVESTGWILFKFQPFNEVNKYINKLRILVIVLTAVFVIFAVFASFVVSRNIYRPFGKLVNSILNQQPNGIPIFGKIDEIGILNEIYKKSNERLKSFENAKMNNREVYISYILKKLILTNSSVTQDEIGKLQDNETLNISLEKPIALCVLKIDRYKEFIAVYAPKDVSLMKFAISNIFTEVITRNYKNNAVDLKDDCLGMILNIDEKEDNFYEVITGLLREAQEFTQNYYNISITASVSSITKKWTEIGKLYNFALDNSMYRYVFGTHRVITSDLVQKNINNADFVYPGEIEKNMIEALKSGNLKKAYTLLESLCDVVSKMNYSNIMLSVAYLINTIKNTVDKINDAKIEQTIISQELLYKQAYEIETMFELVEKFKALFCEIVSNSVTKNDERHAVLVDAINEIIQMKYCSDNLGVQQIASMLKLSPAHLGRIFKANTGCSIPEYINEFRIKKAVELMKTSSLNINQIMLKVGIENESYFYKLFKKYHGTTPKEFIIKNALREI